MYFRLTEAIKRRMIMELRNYWKDHPHYKDLPEHIQGKYSFQERPSYGIIVKISGGTRVDLAADNYTGIDESYVLLTKVPGHNGLAIEWVREDAIAIQRNKGRFPSPAGVYYIHLTEEEEFTVDTMLDARREPVMMTDPTHGMLMHPPIKGTIRIYEQPAGYQLVEGENYTLELDSLGKPTGAFTLAAPLTPGRELSGDYRYAGPQTGPFKFKPNFANNTAIPGVVLAFGGRNKKGDIMAVVVQEIRSPAALVYGGRWDITLDVDVIARDVDAQQEIADQSVTYLWGVLRSRLSSEGIEMMDIALGGESEEIFDDNGDDYFYNSQFTVTLQTDWMVHVPLTLFLRSVSPWSTKQLQGMANMSDEQVAQAQNNIRMVESINLLNIADPFFRHRTATFEKIT